MLHSQTNWRRGGFGPFLNLASLHLSSSFLYYYYFLFFLPWLLFQIGKRSRGVADRLSLPDILDL